jgi:peptidoglycan/LPS O-acetylase OafA/YrhL
VQYLLGTTFENLAIALIVDRSVRVPDDLAGKVLNWAPLVWIGTLSYSLYLWQEPLLNHELRSGIYAYPLNLAVAVAAAIASYYLIERPTLALRDRRAAKRREVVTSP